MDVDGAEEEITMDILSKLPVQSLLRFKCVSTFWMTLISHPYFITKNLNHMKNNKNFLLAKVTLMTTRLCIVQIYRWINGRRKYKNLIGLLVVNH